MTHYKKLFSAFLSLFLLSAHTCQQSVAPIPNIPPMKTTLYTTPIAEEEKPQHANTWDLRNVDVRRIDKNRKLIAITFDDAPSKTLENILAVFAAYNENNPDCPAFATVFFNKTNLSVSTLPLLQTLYSFGFELGNHTASHANLTTLPFNEIQREIREVDEVLQKIDHLPHHLLRAPFGKLSNDVKQAAPAPIVDWTIDTLDWTGSSADSIYHSVMENKFNGAIALMHDGYEGTVSALKLILPALKEAGYQAVTVSQMAKLNGCEMKNGSVYIRLRKQNA